MTWLWLIIECVVIIGGLFLLTYFLNKKRKRQSQIYSIIVDADSETIPLQNIMCALQMDFVSITKDINAMSINREYPLLRNAHIDIGRQTLVLSAERLEKVHKKKNGKNAHNTESNGIQCRNCGATNKCNAIECEYCGSPL